MLKPILDSWDLFSTLLIQRKSIDSSIMATVSVIKNEFEIGIVKLNCFGSWTDQFGFRYDENQQLS